MTTWFLEGVGQMTMFDHDGGGGQNFRKSDHVVYGWPLKNNYYQLHHERTEERRKLVKGKQDGSTGNIHEKWKKILGSALSSQQSQKEERKYNFLFKVNIAICIELIL